MDDIIWQIAQHCQAREVIQIGLTSRRQSAILDDSRIWRPLFGQMPIIRAGNSRYYLMAINAEKRVNKILDVPEDNYLVANDAASHFLYELIERNYGNNTLFETFLPIKNWEFLVGRYGHIAVFNNGGWHMRLQTDKIINLLRLLCHDY